ncbi:MAG TPA: hypothetical protein VF677_13055 [Flavobacterium sp.]|jgi:hypothetical protein
MPQKLTEKALLLCDKGAKPSQLKVTSQTWLHDPANSLVCLLTSGM